MESTAAPSPAGPAGANRAALRWPTALVGALALGAAALAVVAVARSLTGDGPLLPYSLCRPGHVDEILPPLTGSRYLRSWTLNPLATGLLAAAGVLYAGGLRRVGREARRARWQIGRILAFYLGLVVVLLAVSSFVAVYDMTLFWAHMIQHLMLIMGAPALLVIGRPLTLAVAASGPAGQHRLTGLLQSWPVRLVTSPAVALAGYTAVIVGAHLTKLTDSFLSDVWAGQVEHLTYLLIGIVFFWLLFGDEPIAWELSMPGRLLFLMFAMAVDTFVGIVLLQTTKTLDTIPHPSWGMSPIADVQAGGAIMWVAGDGLMAAITIAVFIAWARRPAAERKPSVFERARVTLQAQRAGTVPATAQTPRPVSPGPAVAYDMDDDDRELAAYNRWLANLDRSGRSGS